MYVLHCESGSLCPFEDVREDIAFVDLDLQVVKKSEHLR